MDNSEETYISLCAGVGGLDLGLRLALSAARCICYVEREAFCIANLVDKMEQGWLDTAPVWTNMESFPAARFHRKVRGIIAGLPCQPFSVAGKMLGERDPRDLWSYARRIIRQICPDWAFLESVPQFLRVKFEQVTSDFQAMGYEVAPPMVWAAEDCGATHKRERMFILAYSASKHDRFKRRSKPSPDETISGRRQANRGHPKLAVSGGKLAYPAIGQRCSRQEYRQRIPEAACDRGEELADAEANGYSRRRNSRRGRPRPQNNGLPLFPPAPNDLEAWREVLEVRPDLEPATRITKVKSEIRRVADELANRLDGDLSNEKIRPHKTLWFLWEVYVEKALRAKARRLWRIQTENLLQQILYGPGIQAAESRQMDLLAENQAFEADVLRVLRNLGEIADSSHQWRLVKQFALKHFDTVLDLPHETPLETGRHTGQAGATTLQDMWEALIQNQGETLQYLQDKKAARIANRVDQLRACGNGVVPIQAAVAFCTLVDFARRQMT